MFLALIGVKQGGVISPRLFALYICAIIEAVEGTKVGAVIGNMLLNIMMYADDIILVSFARICLQRLLDLVGEFGLKREIKFNPDKSLVMVFDKSIRKTQKNEIINNPFKMNGLEIPLEIKMRYLGIFYDEHGSHKLHLATKMESATKRLAELNRIGIYSQEMSAHMKAQVYQTMIRPILLYGCEINCYNTGELKQIESLESMMLKEIIGVHKKCHNTDLIPALNLNYTRETIKYYKCKFMIRLLNHPLTAKLIPNIIKTLPAPRSNYVCNLSYLEEMFRNLGIPYNYEQKRYEYSIKLITESCNSQIIQIDQRFSENKTRDRVVLLRELLKLPFHQMVNSVNLEILAINPFHYDEIHIGGLFGNESTTSEPGLN